MRPSLYEFAGGDDAFLALARAHHARCLADPELNHPFSHEDQHPQHVERLAAYWAEVLGGPPRFSQECGDQSAVLDMHAGNGDMSDLGERFLRCFVARDGRRRPARGRRSSGPPCARYMRWAVDDVLSYEEKGDVRDGMAVPRFGWDGPAG